MQISQNFTLEELTRTSQPYDNTPNAEEIERLKILCAKVFEPIRSHFGRPVRVNSAFRSSLVNRAVGSKDTSQHRRGEAGDIEIDGIANVELASYILQSIPFDQLILEAHKRGIPSSGWVHVSYREGRLRGSVLTMTMGSHGPIYTRGLQA